MNGSLKFGFVNVTCEGYENDKDEYISEDSCSV